MHIVEAQHFCFGLNAIDFTQTPVCVPETTANVLSEAPRRCLCSGGVSGVLCLQVVLTCSAQWTSLCRWFHFSLRSAVSDPVLHVQSLSGLLSAHFGSLQLRVCLVFAVGLTVPVCLT